MGVGAETTNDLRLPGTESQQATDLLASRFPPQQNGSSPFVFHVAKGKITDKANKQAVESSYKALSKAPHVHSAPDPFANAASGLVSKDATTAFTPVLLDIPNGDVTDELADSLLDTTAQTIAAFAARLRDQLELDTLTGELLGVVHQTIQPTTASLWLRPPGPSRGS